MAEALVLEFPSISVEQYNAVNKILNIDPTTGDGDWPTGMMSHVGASGPDGSLLVFEVWASQADQAAFMETRLGPALGQVGLGEPSRVEWFNVVGNHAH
jgi:hypothetical protein